MVIPLLSTSARTHPAAAGGAPHGTFAVTASPAAVKRPDRRRDRRPTGDATAGAHLAGDRPRTPHRRCRSRRPAHPRRLRRPRAQPCRGRGDPRPRVPASSAGCCPTSRGTRVGALCAHHRQPSVVHSSFTTTRRSTTRSCSRHGSRWCSSSPCPGLYGAVLAYLVESLRRTGPATLRRTSEPDCGTAGRHGARDPSPTGASSRWGVYNIGADVISLRRLTPRPSAPFTV